MPAAPEALRLRAATGDDLEAVAAIYNAGIEERIATFETDPREAAELAGWLDDGLPFVVAEAGDHVAGWAKAHPYSDRCVYAGIAEHAVYVAPGFRGRGFGRALLEALATEAEAAGLYKLTARILAENAESRAVHRAAGFTEVGLQRRHGRLDGEWRDCVLVERLLGDAG